MAKKPFNTALNKLTAIFDSQQRAINQVQAQIDEIEDSIIATKNRIEDIKAAPIPIEEVESRLNVYLDQCEQATRSSGWIPSILSSPDRSTRDAGFTSIFGMGAVPILAAAAQTSGGFITTLRGSEIIGGLCVIGLRSIIFSALRDEAIGAMTGSPLTDTERQKQLSAAEQELLECESAREAIIRRAEKHNIKLHRSELADPRVLLSNNVDDEVLS